MDNSIAAIPTLYAGVQFRSRLEARFAEWLTEVCRVKWEYEPKHFTSAFPNGYIPDFWIPCIDTFVEIKPKARITEINLFLESIIRSEQYWICVDQLDRGHWTIILQNYTCNITDISPGNSIFIQNIPDNEEDVINRSYLLISAALGIKLQPQLALTYNDVSKILRN